mmetsp:Transcript_13690/g.36918  ORF Transcript_13690/g.36918 Transcript_13690/m.36918 type:complete len:575 (+) Transcript_13690:2265-3989(+)
MGLVKLYGVLLRLDSELLAHVLRRVAAHLAIDLHVDDRHNPEWLDPLSLDAVKLPFGRLHKVHERGVIIWGVAWNARDDAGALVHLDGEEREDVHCVILARRRLHLRAHEVRSHHLQQALRLPPRFQDLLEAHVPGGAGGTHVHLLLAVLVATVLPLGQDPAVRLAGHGLRPQRGGKQEDALSLEFRHLLGEIRKFDLDRRVLLRCNAFALRTVVVHAGLSIQLAEDGRPLAEADLLARLQLRKLPADEGVVVRVHGGGDERPAEVDRRAKAFQVAHTQGRVVLEPVHRILKFHHVFREDAHRLQNLPLERRVARLGQDLLRHPLAAAGTGAAPAFALRRRVQGDLVAFLALWAERAIYKLHADLEDARAVQRHLPARFPLHARQRLCGGVRHHHARLELAICATQKDVVRLDVTVASARGHLPLEGYDIVVHDDDALDLLRLWTPSGKGRVGFAVELVLPLQLVRGCLDRHPCTVKAEGEEHLFAQQAVEMSREDGLCQGERVAYVEQAVHVGVGESAHELFAILRRRVRLEDLHVLPFLLHLLLDLVQKVAPREALLSLGGGHCSRGDLKSW